MKGISSRVLMLATFALLVGLGACGGGDSADDNQPPPQTVGFLSTGVITGFGSVYVNGLSYDTSSAQITMDDAPAVQTQLRVGQYVEVKGHSHDGASHQADVIRYHNVLEGPITDIDTGTDSFVAMGQTVLVTSYTSLGDVINPASVAGLAEGDVVEVSGLVPLEGAVEATRVDIKPDGGPYDVTGYVSNVAGDVNRFNINALVVDYSAANMADFPSGDPGNGDLVLVKGFTFYPDGVFAAINVELRADDWLAPDSGDLVEIEGAISDFVSATEFKVAALPVTTTVATIYENGTVQDLADDVMVKVKGVMSTGGILVASKIAFQQVSTVRIVAQITALDNSGGHVWLLGLNVAVDDSTRYEDISTLHDRDFGFDDLTIGTWVDLRGYETTEGSNAVVATRVVRINPAESVRLRGPFREPAESAFRILSVMVVTSDSTRYLLEEDIHLTKEQFFTQAVDQIVEAWGSWNGTELAAKRAEIKVNDD